MQKFWCLFVLGMLLILCTYVNAQKMRENNYTKSDSSLSKSNTIIKVDIFWPIIGYSSSSSLYSGSIERYFGKRISIQLCGFYGSHLLRYEYTSNWHTTDDNLYFVGPQVRYYLNRTKQNTGFYSGACLLYEHELDIVHDPDPIHPLINTVNYCFNNGYFDIIGGFQHCFYGVIIVDIMAGFGVGMVYSSNTINSINYNTNFYNGISPLFIGNLNIGYKF